MRAEAGGTRIRTLKPEADAYVTAAAPQRNYGRLPVLRADGSPPATTYLRFRHGLLERDPVSVTLLLHVDTGARSGFQVRRVLQDDWGERRLTYATAPRPSRRYASSKPVREGKWSAVDVTPFVRDGDDTITLAVTTRSTLGVVFRSRETKQGPLLVVRSGGDRAD